MKFQAWMGCVAAVLALAGATPAGAQERSLAEVKAEVLRRTAGQINPFEGVRREDAEQILASVTTLDRDQWAQAWCQAGLAYEAKGDARAAQGAPASEVGELYSAAANYCRIGRYPTASTPGKKEAYRQTVRLFRKAAKYFAVPLQVVEIPFEGKTLVGYLQVPTGARPAVVMKWGGVDTWKEDTQHLNNYLHRAGLATLTVDMPGTGENPALYGSPVAERSYSAWLDHLLQRSDVDGSRVAVWGQSFGGYWAARLAYAEATRIKGAVFHGGNAHYGFQREWLVPAFTTGGATYLFGPASLLEARGQAMGTETMEDFLNAAPRLSLLALGMVDKPSAPILGVNGKRDDQAPVQDIYFLMEHGSPKEARIYPEGRHMGRSPGMKEDEIPNMIIAWLKERLAR